MSASLADLQRLVEQYVEVAYLDSAEIDAMTDDEQRRSGDTYRALAVRITDLVIEAGMHRGQVLR